MLMTTLVGDKS